MLSQQRDRVWCDSCQVNFPVILGYDDARQCTKVTCSTNVCESVVRKVVLEMWCNLLRSEYFYLMPE